ncbi:hypothetical protein PVAR5_7179 [Paecilomyces variotii No. 5]|uniref:Uncharacterized protein n=1 Tax=Byssochlamys spectabilis (strain No. 5 / NBRC 109023) TaxID=1356009 RepID=V5I4I4_BYSSN|nr:hypothetical protein PVAR5_7179 [Paecilomyces variotii No. 5]
MLDRPTCDRSFSLAAVQKQWGGSGHLMEPGIPGETDGLEESPGFLFWEIRHATTPPGQSSATPREKYDADGVKWRMASVLFKFSRDHRSLGKRWGDHSRGYSLPNALRIYICELVFCGKPGVEPQKTGLELRLADEIEDSSSSHESSYSRKIQISF